MPDYEEWLTYSELADRLGISKDAAKMLARRKDWPRQPANSRGGVVRVLVSNVPDHRNTQNGGNIPEHRPGLPHNVLSVPERVLPSPTPAETAITLGKALSMVSEAVSQARADHATEIARVQSLHLDLISRLQAQAAAERAIFMERVDGAEIRAEAAEARAAAVDAKLHQVLDRLLERQVGPAPDGRSWWSRWFGVSKRSEIG